jgi:hypothetical protein
MTPLSAGDDKTLLRASFVPLRVPLPQPMRQVDKVRAVE